MMKLKSLLSKYVIIFIFFPISFAFAQNEPESMDLRTYFHPVQDQGNSNASAIFAITALAEMFPGVPKLSKIDLYANYLRYKLQKNIYTPGHVDFEELVQILDENPFSLIEESKNETFYAQYQKFLISTNSDKPGLNINKFELEQSSEAADAIQNYNRYKLDTMELHRKETIDTTFIKNRLQKFIPVAVNMNIKMSEWLDFKNRKLGEIGFSNSNDAKEETATPHSVAIVGYRNDPLHGVVFIFRNSWGSHWGDSGYGYFTEKYFLKNVISALTADYISLKSPQNKKKTNNSLYCRENSSFGYDLKINTRVTNSIVEPHQGYIQRKNIVSLHTSLLINKEQNRIPKKVVYSLVGISKSRKITTFQKWSEIVFQFSNQDHQDNNYVIRMMDMVRSEVIFQHINLSRIEASDAYFIKVELHFNFSRKTIYFPLSKALIDHSIISAESLPIEYKSTINDSIINQ